TRCRRILTIAIGTGLTARASTHGRSTIRATTADAGGPSAPRSVCERWNTCDGELMETPLPPDFSDFSKLLDSEKVEYLVVGGYAVSYHGYPRPTGDLDVWIAVDIKNARRVKATLERFGFANDPGRPEDLLVPNRIFRMGVPPVRIEVLTGATGVDFPSCYSR